MEYRKPLPTLMHYPRRTEHLHPPTIRRRRFRYDAAGQLTAASGGRTESYSYDRNGNRTRPGYQTGPANRLSGDGTYSYASDNEWNLLRKTRLSDGQVTEFVWDYRNRMSGVVVKDTSGQVIQYPVFTYDVFDRRIGKRVDADGAGPDVGSRRWSKTA